MYVCMSLYMWHIVNFIVCVWVLKHTLLLSVRVCVSLNMLQAVVNFSVCMCDGQVGRGGGGGAEP